MPVRVRASRVLRSDVLKETREEFWAPGPSTRTYNPAPTLWKYDPGTNIPWLKLTDASNNTSWFPVQLGQFPQSVDYTGAA
jgi:hypothetical protein